jgi:hypothetical protein
MLERLHIDCKAIADQLQAIAKRKAKRSQSDAIAIADRFYEAIAKRMRCDSRAIAERKRFDCNAIETRKRCDFIMIAKPLQSDREGLQNDDKAKADR